MNKPALVFLVVLSCMEAAVYRPALFASPGRIHDFSRSTGSSRLPTYGVNNVERKDEKRPKNQAGLRTKWEERFWNEDLPYEPRGVYSRKRYQEWDRSIDESEASNFQEIQSPFEERKKEFVWGGGPRKEDYDRPLKVNLDILTYRARRAQQRKNYTLAVRLWKRAMEMDPKDGRAWVAMGNYESKTKRNPNRAREMYNEGLESCPGNAYLLQALGILEQRQGDLSLAMELFKKATRLDPTHVASWVARGELESRFRRPSEARLCFRRAVQAEPKSYYAWHCWAILEEKCKNELAARELFRRSISANPRNAASYQAWGVLEARLGNLDMAVELFEKGHEASPKNTHVMQAWACIESRRGNSELAISLLEKAMGIRPSDAAVYQAYAMLCRDLDDSEGALRLLELGLKADKTHLANYEVLGRIRANKGDIDEARRIFQQGIWAAPKTKGVARLWTAWALAEAEAGDPDQARGYFKLALAAESSHSSNTLILISWAKVEEEDGKIDRARSIFETAVRFDEQNRRLWTSFEAFERRVSGHVSQQTLSVAMRKDMCITPREGVSLKIEPYPIQTEAKEKEPPTSGGSDEKKSGV